MTKIKGNVSQHWRVSTRMKEQTMGRLKKKSVLLTPGHFSRSEKRWDLLFTHLFSEQQLMWNSFRNAYLLLASWRKDLADKINFEHVDILHVNRKFGSYLRTLKWMETLCVQWNWKLCEKVDELTLNISAYSKVSNKRPVLLNHLV